jgi:DNA-binding PadR family transcriptional regulator
MDTRSLRMIEQTSDDVFEVEQGSLYPALHRLEDRRWVAAYWGTSENNRKAKFLQIDRSGAESIKRGAEPLAGAGRGDRESDARRTMQWLRSFAHPRRMLSG